MADDCPDGDSETSYDEDLKFFGKKFYAGTDLVIIQLPFLSKTLNSSTIAVKLNPNSLNTWNICN